MQTTVNSLEKNFRLRSYVRRGSRVTPGQARAFQASWTQIGLNDEGETLNFAKIFNNSRPCYLEIGFGMGQSLLAAAQAHPDKNFIGIDVHKPGIGSVCQGISALGLTNLRLCNGDAVVILEKLIAENSLQGVQIFFPDPWPKRRHHGRRIIQPAFSQLLTNRLVPQGTLHLATDWEDYAEHMQRVLANDKHWANACQQQFAPRSLFRPIITKFEQRALHEGKKIWELQFYKL